VEKRAAEGAGCNGAELVRRGGRTAQIAMTGGLLGIRRPYDLHFRDGRPTCFSGGETLGQPRPGRSASPRAAVVNTACSRARSYRLAGLLCSSGLRLATVDHDRRRGPRATPVFRHRGSLIRAREGCRFALSANAAHSESVCATTLCAAPRQRFLDESNFRRIGRVLSAVVGSCLCATALSPMTGRIGCLTRTG
jgi:hypothetical protein